MLTNCFGLNILRTTLLGGILDLLIKSKLLSVHRRVQQSTAGTVLAVSLKTVPAGRK